MQRLLRLAPIPEFVLAVVDVGIGRFLLTDA
jgi:hypothetical protein